MARYRTVTEFLLKVRETYNKAREQYVELSDRVVKLNSEWEAEKRRGWSNQEQANADRERYNRMKNDAKKALTDHIADTNAKFQAISDECDSVFGIYDRATGDKVDLATVELLKSGILRDDEIYALANDFDGNTAMLRLIGDYACSKGEKDHNAELRAKGLQLKQHRFPYKEHIDSLVYWSQQALRENRGLSDGIAKVYDEQADKIIAGAEGIYITVGE